MSDSFTTLIETHFPIFEGIILPYLDIYSIALLQTLSPSFKDTVEELLYNNDKFRANLTESALKRIFSYFYKRILEDNLEKLAELASSSLDTSVPVISYPILPIFGLYDPPTHGNYHNINLAEEEIEEEDEEDIVSNRDGQAGKKLLLKILKDRQYYNDVLVKECIIQRCSCCYQKESRKRRNDMIRATNREAAATSLHSPLLANGRNNNTGSIILDFSLLASYLKPKYFQELFENSSMFPSAINVIEIRLKSTLMKFAEVNLYSPSSFLYSMGYSSFRCLASISDDSQGKLTGCLISLPRCHLLTEIELPLSSQSSSFDRQLSLCVNASLF
jgi:hypothetical protein